MHGNVGIRSTFSFGSDTLIESGTEVGLRDYSSVNTEFYGEFAPIQNLSIAFTLPFQNETYSFQNVSQMEFSPQQNSGSYLNTEDIEDFSREGSGLLAPSVGIFFYPFHNRLYEERADRGAWKIGLSYRFVSNQHFFTTTPSAIPLCLILIFN